MSRKTLINLLIVLFLIGGGPQNQTGLLAQSSDKKRPPSTQPRDKTKSRPQPKARKPRPTGARQKSTDKRRRPTSATPRQRPPSARAKSADSDRRRQPAAKEQSRRPPRRKASTRPRPGTRRQPDQSPRRKPTVPRVNVVKLADDIYSLTDQLTSSNRQMQQAAGYLQPLQKRTIVRLDSRTIPDIGNLEQQAATQPDDIRKQRQLAKAYERLQRVDDAKDVYLRLAYQHSENADVHYYLGSFYSAIGQNHNARAAFREALQRNPDHQATLDAVMAYPELSSRYVTEPQTGVKLDTPETDQAVIQLQNIRQELDDGNLKSALTLAKVGLEKFPGQGSFAMIKGKIYEEMGDNPAAHQAYREALTINPDHVEVYQAQADLYLAESNYLYAALACQQVIRLNPLSVTYRHKQGLSYYQAGEWGRAAATWEDLLNYAPRHQEVLNYLPQVYYVLATEYNRMGQSSLGRTSFEKALSVNSDAHRWLPEALTTLGIHYRDQALFRESLSSLQEALELRPKDALAYTELGLTYWKMGERRLARAAWQRSLELNPENNTARGWLILSRQSG